MQERGEEAPPQEEDAGPGTEIDITQARHRGQFALRKLYHESDRVMVVFYTQPGCGPCRSLKPVLSKVVDEFPGKVRPVLHGVACLAERAAVTRWSDACIGS